MTSDDLYHELVRLGWEWSDCNAASHLLEETKRSVRAQCAMEHLAKGGAVAKAELAADADKRYIEHLQAMVAAKKKANIARINYDALGTKIDLYRSQLANERAQMNLR